jgi:hypothetical protein
MPVIRLKTGTTTPGAGSLNRGELAVTTTNNNVNIGDASGNPVKIIGTVAGQESNSVSITGGSVSGATNTATNANFTSLTLNAGERIWYNEDADCRATIGNWNDATYYNMTDCAGLGNCYIHGWTAGPRDYILSLSGIPAHTQIKYECYIHHVDSWDNEANQVYVTNDAASYVQMASWTKVNSAPPSNLTSYNNTTLSWWGNKYYSYAPWNGNPSTDNPQGRDQLYDGYLQVTTDWTSHTASTIQVKHHTDLNQDASDEAFYISHVKLWIRGGNTPVTSVTTSTSLSTDFAQLATENAVKSYIDSNFTGTLKNLYSYTGNNTYTKSGSDVRMIRVICVGGGGGGRGYHESGGAGGFCERWIDASQISTVSVTVGSGTGGGYYFGFGSQGGTTSFGSYCSATGGYGANQNRSHAGGHGGVGSGGQFNLYGGGGGGHLGNYNNQGSGGSGQGGASFFGGGGQGRHGSHGFNPVAAPGGGGPGGAGNHNGSDGYTGICLVYEYK